MKLLLAVFASCLCHIACARVLVVGKDFSYTSIIKAVSAAQSKDTILVKKGIYKEGNIVITKRITLIGEEAILDGEKKFEILTVSANGVRIKGFTFRNSGASTMNDFASIKVIDALGFIIENNTILNSYFAIHISNSNTFIIRQNIIKGVPGDEQNTGNGIHLWKCEKANITGNDIQGHRDGIYFEFVKNSHIIKNSSQRNIRYGLHFMFSNDDVYSNNYFSDNGAGVAVMFSRNITMSHNDFVKNIGASAYGLLLKEISDGTIYKNNFSGNTIGMFVEGANRLVIKENKFIRNGYAMRMQASCNENVVERNNFVANTFDVATNGSLMLNTLKENFWDKYEGYDLNKDGKGDIPYRPVSVYALIIENAPVASIFMRSFMTTILDKTEKAIPVLIPENFKDDTPLMKPNPL
ncbi:MAG: nitrous oxide reductase family maturation protein NosD [Bacteroidetes bacterium]|nr:nitrous oxide reductase family maturation protein NosD [Bacteroidota bacterium]